MPNLHLIRDLCERKNISIRELAQRIGRDVSSVQSSIRRGSTSATTIELIAKELGVSPSIFFENHDKEEDAIRQEMTHLKELLKEMERTIETLMRII